ncbi:MAG: SDR family NAD(P)-dependent oxidoreductase [Planctomycetota bacterium]|nr:MAG: SDR family NAD(P)-dependent oxidoreductase [Planctomycetota bacterium]
MDLRDQVVLVTGASAGIGRACVRAFAAAGARVAFCGRRRDRLEALAEELAAAGAEVHPFVLDVRRRQEVAAALAGLPEPFSAPGILVNNAGLSRGLDPIQDGEWRDWEEMIETNVKGLLWVTRAVVPGMVARGRGHVINIGSIAGREVYPGGAVYCASKHAVAAITRGLRLDLNQAGIRVSTVDPGLVNTEFSTVRFRGDRTRADATYAGMTPLTAEDVADAVLWAATRPAHVNVAEILLLPTDQAAATVVRRRG